jgi:hypothetical protein
MGEVADLDLGVIGQPCRWYVVFNTKATTPLRSLLAFGRFKHVRVFGYVPLIRCWIFYDVKLSGTDLWLARDGAACRLMDQWSANGVVIEMPVLSQSRIIVRLGFWCVPAVKHLLGLRSSAFRPDRLWLDCLRTGGKVVYDGRIWRPVTPVTAADTPRSNVRPFAESGT